MALVTAAVYTRCIDEATTSGRSHRKPRPCGPPGNLTAARNSQTIDTFLTLQPARRCYHPPTLRTNWLFLGTNHAAAVLGAIRRHNGVSRDWIGRGRIRRG